MAITDSLDAATQQVLALLAQLKTSNARVVQGQDTGAADAITVNPVPGVAAYGSDLIVMVDVANANQTTTPTINISSLGKVGILTATGSAPAVKAIYGKCFFGFSSVSGGGYTARLLAGGAAALASITAQQILNITGGVGFSGSKKIQQYQPSSPSNQTISQEFTAPVKGTVLAFSTASSTAQSGLANSITITVNGSIAAQTGDSVAGSINDVAVAQVSINDDVLVASMISNSQALQYNVSQQLNFLFFPS